MNFIFIRTLGMYFIYFKSLLKGEKLSLKEIWNKKDDYDLAFYGAILWIFILFLCFGIVIYCVKNNLSVY